MSVAALVAARKEVGPVTRTDLVRYAGASGDFNPVHHDDVHARSLGFPSVFAMGMFPAGALAAHAADRLGPHNLSRLAVRFVAPTWPADRMVLEVGDPAGRDQIAAISVTAGGDARISGSVVVGAPGSTGPATRPLDSAEPRLQEILRTRLEPVELPVERGKVIEFARAVQAGPVHHDLAAAHAAGLDDVAVPPTFTTCVAHWAGGDASALPLAAGLTLARVLHAEQRYRFHRPIAVGQTLRGERRISSAFTKRSRSGGALTFVTVTTEFVDEAGAPVVDEEMVMLEREIPAHGPPS